VKLFLTPVNLIISVKPYNFCQSDRTELSSARCRTDG